jgi:phospholipid/cholesterol/gamma-HCH transport system substrate-binding protein
MKISREFLIGVLVVIAISLLYMGVNYLKGVNLFLKQQKYFAIYENAAGLTSSNPVILNGFKIGIVKDVHMHEDGSGRIVAEVVLNDHKLKVPKDTRLEIFDADLFGGKAIQIMLGTSSELADNKDTLASGISMGLTESIKQEIEPLKQKTAQLFSGVDSVITNLNSVLSGPQIKNLGDIFVSLKNTMENLEGTSSKLNGVIDANTDNLSKIFDHVEAITENLESNNDLLTKAIKNAALITDSLAALNLSSTIAKVDLALTDFNSLMTNINEGNGTIGKLIHTDSLHTQLVTASHSLDLLLNDMRIHPKRYLSFSLISRNQEKAEFSKKELEQMRDEIDKALEEKKRKEGQQ